MSERGAMANAFDPNAGGARDPALDALLSRRRALLGPAYRLFYRTPLHVVRADGVFLYDADGRRYLDAYNNVAAVGHGNARVVAAVAGQLARLNTHTRYVQDGILDFAETLLDSLGGDLAHVVFTCTGSEANDLATRIAMHRTGRRGIVATRWAYHGNSHLTAGFSPALGAAAPLGEHVRLIPAPDTAEAVAARLEEAIAELERAGHGFAALIVDSLFTSDGIFPEAGDTVRRLAEIVRARGGLLIADEVQSGFGRVGQAFWGYRLHGVAPDLVTMGKPMGNGYPVGAVATTADAVARFGAELRYFNTFGGSTAAIAAAQATWDVIRDDRLAQNADAVGGLIVSRLKELARDHPAIAEVRGAGLYVGVELKDPATGAPAPETAFEIVNHMREHGVLISATGERANVMKIRPPLVFDRPCAEELVAAVGNALSALPR